MKVNYKKIIAITLVIAWMILVFYLSNQVSTDSAELSGSFTKIILEIFDNSNSITLEQISLIETVIRKIAHFSIYTLGGILIFSSVNLHNIKPKNKVLISWTIGTVYAITDEIHQLFVLGRSGEIRDVCIDSLGVITGIIILLLTIKVIDNIRNRKKENINGK